MLCTVSYEKATAGGTTMFAGIVQMLEALEPQWRSGCGHCHSGDTISGYRCPPQSTDAEEGENVETETADSGVPDSAVPDDGVPDDGAAEVSEVKQEDTPTATAAAATTVTEDDITKIIVRKIKQDRSNNEKIGAILRTYGAAKVSDLPVAKYEAFLTDVSQL